MKPRNSSGVNPEAIADFSIVFQNSVLYEDPPLLLLLGPWAGVVADDALVVFFADLDFLVFVVAAVVVLLEEGAFVALLAVTLAPVPGVDAVVAAEALATEVDVKPEVTVSFNFFHLTL